jgi:hypothetical protein
LRNPVLLAHSLTTLDVISQGRLSVAVNVAGRSKYNEREFIACGVPFREKAGRLGVWMLRTGNENGFVKQSHQEFRSNQKGHPLLIESSCHCQMTRLIEAGRKPACRVTALPAKLVEVKSAT